MYASELLFAVKSCITPNVRLDTCKGNTCSLHIRFYNNIIVFTHIVLGKHIIIIIVVVFVIIKSVII